MDCGAGIAETARILLLMAAVTFWVGGFDVMYACQDYDFDRGHGLHSVPQVFGDSSGAVGGSRISSDDAGIPGGARAGIWLG